MVHGVFVYQSRYSITIYFKIQNARKHLENVTRQRMLLPRNNR